MPERFKVVFTMQGAIQVLSFTFTFTFATSALASCLIYARTLIEYVIFILWVRSVSKMLSSVKFAVGKVLTFLILREKC